MFPLTRRFRTETVSLGWSVRKPLFGPTIFAPRDPRWGPAPRDKLVVACGDTRGGTRPWPSPAPDRSARVRRGRHRTEARVARAWAARNKFRNPIDGSGTTRCQQRRLTSRFCRGWLDTNRRWAASARCAGQARISLKVALGGSVLCAVSVSLSRSRQRCTSHKLCAIAGITREPAGFPG